MTIRTNLLGAAAALALLVPLAASAEEGFYLGGNAGLSISGGAEYDDNTNTNDLDSDPGFAGILSGGYQFDNNWRVQGEFAARLNQVEDITGTGAAAPIDGSVNVYSLMADAIYGIPTGTKFTPYVGAGAGIAWVDANDVATILGTTVDDTDTVFAYQGIAGVEYDISSNLKAALDYRYFRTAETSFTAVSSADVDGNYENHTVTLGLRYLFPAAAAPVEPPAPVAEVPPPPPSVPNNYIVFFDFDRSNISEDADRIVAAAAANAQQAKATTIEVAGHADRSGSARYNMRLSQRRADSIKQALVARVIPADQIVVTDAGESQPLVATADGVREAQNRRVQIVLK